MKQSLVAIGLLLFIPTAAHSQWSYSQFQDEMTDKAVRIAMIRSPNGAATLRIRNREDRGVSVWLTLEAGAQFADREGAFTVRFDDDKPVSMWTAGASDYSTNVQFVTSYREFDRRFIDLAAKAKRIRMQANVYHGGQQVFEFTTAVPLSKVELSIKEPARKPRTVKRAQLRASPPEEEVPEVQLPSPATPSAPPRPPVGWPPVPAEL